MSVVGKISYGRLNTLNFPIGQVVLIGVDGQHYGAQNTDVGLTGWPWRVGWVEGNGGAPSIILNISNTDWRNSLAGLAMGLSGTFTPHTVIPAPGTPYFYITGTKAGAGEFVGVLYKINSPVSVTVVGGFAFGIGTGSQHPHRCNSANVIDGKLYAFLESGFGNPSFTLETWLYELPLDETTTVDLTPFAIYEHGWRLSEHGSHSHYSWHSTNSFNGAAGHSHFAIIPDGDLIGIVRYVAEPEGAGIFYLTVDFAAALPGDGSPRTIDEADIQDISADFGFPFADAGLNFAGAPAPDYTNDYTPSVAILGDGRIEFLFTRGFTDTNHMVRIRRFLWDEGVVTFAGETTFTHNADAFYAQPRLVQSWREGDEIVVGLMDLFRVIFGSVTIPVAEPPTVVYPDIDTTEEDTVDELPAADALIVVQRWLLRTGHIREWGEITVDDLRVTIKRGVGDTEAEPQLWVRANRDNRSWTKWARKGLGKKGDRTMTLTFGGFGTARDWQFEFATTDDCEIHLRKADIMRTQLGH